MKKYHLLIVVFLFSLTMSAQGQGAFLLNLYGGYTFSDKVDFDSSYAKVEDGFEYGAGFEYFIMDNASIELKYNRLDTKMPLYTKVPIPGYGIPAGGQVNAGDDKGAINYILADYTYYFGSSSQKAVPFLGAGAGISILESPKSGSGTYFAWEIKGGVKIKTDSPVSISLNAYLQSMSAAVGYDYYWDYYWGPVAVTDYASTFQFGLGAVVSFNLNKK
ncbi:Outer membrane protein beta-barrel domain-containing protein [Flavobacterium resistens]|uniref:Outer membrane beta-barrel protein n=1 Tax=Flavobacterium resistens TaxID=443612 RepID=A0A521F381_9FLAO|nr:OmpA family protein [Flavobacterium resistens]MRX69509.1 outer membrane beta-barrel protein [Flavobacterium resistens]SMO90654.1 Outer membrane protein beta-barrel domain-containing protein [Flavobacterium resistens]